jgi:hypothetical protein
MFSIFNTEHNSLERQHKMKTILFESTRLAKLSGINEDVFPADKGQFVVDNPHGVGIITFHWDSDADYLKSWEEVSPHTDKLLQSAKHIWLRYPEEKEHPESGDPTEDIQIMNGAVGWDAILSDDNVKLINYGGDSGPAGSLEAAAIKNKRKRLGSRD